MSTMVKQLIQILKIRYIFQTLVYISDSYSIFTSFNVIYIAQYPPTPCSPHPFPCQYYIFLPW